MTADATQLIAESLYEMQSKPGPYEFAVARRVLAVLCAGGPVILHDGKVTRVEQVGWTWRFPGKDWCFTFRHEDRPASGDRPVWVAVEGITE